MKIYLVFQPKDMKGLSKSVSAPDIIFGNIRDSKTGHLVSPSYNHLLGRAISDDVIMLFDRLSVKFGHVIKGYANNFQECSIEPLLMYLSTLESIIDKFKLTYGDVEVVFPRKILLTQKSSTYYLAEHESQGRRFYSHEDYFYPYIHDLCRKKKVLVSYSGIKVGGRIYIWNILRLWLVFLYRFYMDVRRSLVRKVINKPAQGQYDIVAITRMPTQSGFLKPFISQSRFRYGLVISESFLNLDKNLKTVIDKFKKIKNVELIITPALNFSLVCNKYISVIPMLFRIEESENIQGYDINITQAIKEMLVMLPSLLLYESEITTALNQIGPVKYGTVLTTEQKSPHAFVDAQCCKRKNYKCFHLMQCDQHPKPLPMPVAGDVFLTDTLSYQAKLKEAMRLGDDKEKAIYIGSFKSVKTGPVVSLEYRRERLKWCFFASDSHIKNNIDLAWSLGKLADIYDFDFMIKLHPRDSGKGYPRAFKKNIWNFNTDESLSNRFDFALSYPSGIIQDLIYENIPFVIYAPHEKYDHANYVYLVEDYGPIFIERPDEVEKWVSQPENMISAFNEYRQRFLRHNGIISDPKSIESNLIELMKRIK